MAHPSHWESEAVTYRHDKSLDMIFIAREKKRHRRETGLQVLTAETAFFDQVFPSDMGAKILVGACDAKDGEKPVQADADNYVVCFRGLGRKQHSKGTVCEAIDRHNVA